MTKRSVGWILAGLVFVAASPFMAAGCGHSLEGDYIRLCKQSCDAGNDCENRTKVVVDREKCERDCENDSDNFAANVEDECGKDYEILGDNVDRCSDSINKLADACRNGGDDDYNTAAGNYLEDCVNTAFVRCK